MKNWYMLTLVGKDRPRIVAEISQTLFEAGGNLGEASMSRLGGNFTVMLMQRMEAEKENVRNLLQPVCEKMELFFHVDNIVADLHQQVDPNYRLSVHGADQVGIVAAVTRSLAKSDFNILNLESDFGGSEEKPVYIMHIEGFANCGREEFERSLQQLKKEKEIVMHLVSIDTMVG